MKQSIHGDEHLIW